MLFKDYATQLVQSLRDARVVGTVRLSVTLDTEGNVIGQSQLSAAFALSGEVTPPVAGQAP